MKKSFLIGLVISSFIVGSISSKWLGANPVTNAHAQEVLADLPIEKMQEFAEVYTRIRNQYVEEVSADRLIEQAISGMVSSLDPHSSYLSEKDLVAFQEGLKGEEFGGLGIYVGTKDDWIQVVSPIFDTPAHRANLSSGDLILKIDGVSTKGMEIDAAVRKMRGKIGTLISIEIFSIATKKTKKIELIRAKITSPSVVSSLLKDGYAYVRVSRFQEKTSDNLVENLNNLYKENKEPIKGIVLDLRNNPGGFLVAGIDVASAFLPAKQLIVSDKGRAQEEKIFYGKIDYSHDKSSALNKLKNTKQLESVPMVVLVNRGSASASEIVAGALKDTKRAVIVGERTYGKASVQSVSPLRTYNGKTALRLTTARYYTPLGTNIQARGIIPDIPVKIKINNDDDKDEEQDEAFAIRESNIEGHLKNNDDNSETSEGNPDDTRSDRPPFVNENDNQYYQALSILKAIAIVAN